MAYLSSGRTDGTRCAAANVELKSDRELCRASHTAANVAERPLPLCLRDNHDFYHSHIESSGHVHQNNPLWHTYLIAESIAAHVRWHH